MKKENKQKKTSCEVRVIMDWEDIFIHRHTQKGEEISNSAKAEIDTKKLRKCRSLLKAALTRLDMLIPDLEIIENKQLEIGGEVFYPDTEEEKTDLKGDQK